MTTTGERCPVNPTGEHGPTQRDVSGALFCGWCGVDLDDLNEPATPSGAEPRCGACGGTIPIGGAALCSAQPTNADGTRRFCDTGAEPECRRGKHEGRVDGLQVRATAAASRSYGKPMHMGHAATQLYVEGARTEGARLLNGLRGEIVGLPRTGEWRGLVRLPDVLEAIDRIKRREAQ